MDGEFGSFSNFKVNVKSDQQGKLMKVLHRVLLLWLRKEDNLCMRVCTCVETNPGLQTPANIGFSQYVCMDVCICMCVLKIQIHARLTTESAVINTCTVL